MSPHVTARLSPFMDGELSSDERGEVEAHLRDCADCARELSDLLEIDALARDLPLAAPAGYFESFPSRVRGRLRSRPVGRTWPRWTWAAAAALVLAVLTPLTLREKRAELGAPALPTPETTPGRVLGGEAGIEARVPEKKQAERPPSPGPVAKPPEQGRFEDELRLRQGEKDLSATRSNEETRTDREKAKQARRPPSSSRTVAAPPATTAPPASPPTSAPAPAQSAASSAPRDAREGFAAPPPSSTEARVPPAAEIKARAPRPGKGSSPPTSYVEQHGPRAQAQAPASVPEPQAPPAEDAPQMPTPPGETDASKRRADADEKRRGGGGSDGAAKLEELSKDDEQAAAGRMAQTGTGYASNVAPETGDVLYGALSARTMSSVGTARDLREAWRSFLRAYPKSPRADDARVRVIEASALAWQLGADPADREAAERDAAAYLRRPDAAQKQRVRAILAEIAP